MCVSIYAFVTGYGFASKLLKYQGTLWQIFIQDIKTCLCSCLKFMCRFWLIFFLFVAIGLVIGKLKFHPQEFVLNFFGFSNSYNNEWWYVKTYIKMLIIIPFIDLLLRFTIKNKKISIVFASIILISIFVIPFLQDILIEVIQRLNLFVLIMAEGFLIRRLKVFDIINDISKNNWLIAGLIFLVTFARIIISPNMYDTSFDWLFAPCFVYSTVLLIKFIKNKYVLFILNNLGKYSVYIWLSHTFIIYYYFNEMIMCLKYIPLIYCITIISCLIVGIILDYIYFKIYYKVKGRFKNNDNKKNLCAFKK